MPIIYNKLFYMLIDLGMKKKDLQEKANITASIMARLTRNETVRTDTIEKICEALQCQPGDIMEHIEIEDLIDPKTNKTVKEKLITKPELYNPDTYQDVKDPEKYIRINTEGK